MGLLLHEFAGGLALVSGFVALFALKGGNLQRRGGLVFVCIARPEDLARIVRMMADDPLGAQREQVKDPVPAAYQSAFQAIQEDANNQLAVAVVGRQVVGVLQITFLPGITYEGAWRAQIKDLRGGEVRSPRSFSAARSARSRVAPSSRKQPLYIPGEPARLRVRQHPLEPSEVELILPYRQRYRDYRETPTPELPCLTTRSFTLTTRGDTSPARIAAERSLLQGSKRGSWQKGRRQCDHRGVSWSLYG